jgi:cytochrome P450
MTVRTVDKADFQLVGGYPVPVGTPIHLHMWSLQNTSRTWEKPKEFKPDRWSASADIDTDTDTLTESEDGTGAQALGAVKPSAGPPRCPFMAASEKPHSPYDGAGHSDGALSFFPFSAGARACPAQRLALQVLRRVLCDVVLKFRLDPYEAFWDEDLGASVNATIMPMLKKSTTIKVKKLTAAGAVEEVVKEVQEDGWADEDDDEEKYQKVEVPTTH